MVLQRLGGGRDLVSPWREQEEDDEGWENICADMQDERVVGFLCRCWKIWLSDASHLLGVKEIIHAESKASSESR